MPSFDAEYLARLNKSYDKGVFVRAVKFVESPSVTKYWVDHSQSILFQGNTYEPLRMLWQNIKASSVLNLEGAELTVSNLARKAEDYVETIDVKGNEVVVQLLHLSLLNTLTNFYERKFFVQAVRADVQAITFTIGRELGWTEDEFDDAWGITEQAYYNQLVEGHDGDEPLDVCDYLVSERAEGLEHLQTILAEGRASFIPVGTKWRYSVDRPRSPVMLVSEPKNVIENSVVSEPVQPDPLVNYMFAEYRDGDNRDIPNLVSLPDPEWQEGDPIISDAIKLKTIRRESQADREAMYHRKRQALVRRRWECQGTQRFLYAEPMQAVYFYFPTASHLRGHSGSVRDGSDSSNVILDRTVELEAGQTYQIVIQHESGAVETRTIDTAAGNRVRVHVTTPFATAPAVHDAYSLDKVDPVQRTVVLDNLEYSDGEPIRLSLSDYVPEVYTSDPLPPKSVRRYFDLQRMAPLPLRDASVVEESAITRDGSHTSTLIFDVTPGLARVAGVGSILDANRIILADTEVTINDHFIGATLRLKSGPSAGVEATITAYDGATRIATVSGVVLITDPSATLFDPELFAPNLFQVFGTDSEYEIIFLRFGELTGFKIELSSDGIDFAELVTYSGTRGEYHDRIEAGLQYFRFTPISNGTENRIARLIRSITLHGDQSAPAAPARVTLAAHLKQVSVDIFQQRPTAEDLATFEVHWYRIDPGNVFVFLRAVEVPVPQDNGATGEMLRRHTHNFSDQEYGAVIWAKVLAKDRSGNPKDPDASAFTTTQNTVTLTQVLQGDIDDGALTDFADFANDAIVNTNGTDGAIAVEVASVILATTGRPILLWANVTVENTDEVVGAPLILEIRRGEVFGSSILIDTLEINHGAQESRRYPMQRVNWPAPGTHHFKLWAREPLSSVVWALSVRRLLALEIKDKAEA